MVIHLGSLVILCCAEGGTLQTNIHDVCRECSQCLGHTGFTPTHGMCAFPVYTAQAQVALQGNCLKWALGCMHFPGLRCSGSGSRVLHKVTDLVGSAFCALSRSEQLRRPGVWRVHTPQVGGASYHLPRPSQSFSWVHSGSAISGMPCVSSGELVSGCDPPGWGQPSSIPRRLG